MKKKVNALKEAAYEKTNEEFEALKAAERFCIELSDLLKKHNVKTHQDDYDRSMQFEVAGYIVSVRTRHSQKRKNCLTISPEGPMIVSPGDSILETTEVRFDLRKIHTIGFDL